MGCTRMTDGESFFEWVHRSLDSFGASPAEPDHSAPQLDDSGVDRVDKSAVGTI
jgi:hypothetical protein